MSRPSAADDGGELSRVSPPRGWSPTEDEGIAIATWNMCHWTAAKVGQPSASATLDVVALQETHLAELPLERAHTTARQHGWSLQHGRPVPASGHSEHGRACGVGFWRAWAFRFSRWCHSSLLNAAFELSAGCM